MELVILCSLWTGHYLQLSTGQTPRKGFALPLKKKCGALSGLSDFAPHGFIDSSLPPSGFNQIFDGVRHGYEFSTGAFFVAANGFFGIGQDRGVTGGTFVL